MLVGLVTSESDPSLARHSSIDCAARVPLK
jgi:hypothetical protein